jgi:hypothetical protein
MNGKFSNLFSLVKGFSSVRQRSYEVLHVWFNVQGHLFVDSPKLSRYTQSRVVAQLKHTVL